MPIGFALLIGTLFALYVSIFSDYGEETHQEYVYQSGPNAQSIGDDRKDMIQYVHRYIQEHQGDGVIEKKVYTLSKDDFEKGMQSRDIQVYDQQKKFGLIPVQMKAGKNPILRHTIYPEITCSNREDVELTGYQVKSDVMTGFPRGFYNATLDIPEDMDICEDIHQ